MTDIGFGGMPLIQPSTLCTYYLKYAKVVPERTIRVGARYRVRRDLVEHVRGYRNLKRSLQRKLADIEHERRSAHFALPTMSTLASDPSFSADANPFPRPHDCAHYHLKSFTYHPGITRDYLFKRKTEIGNYIPRQEGFIGMVDIRRKLMKNPSEKLQKDE